MEDNSKITVIAIVAIVAILLGVGVWIYTTSGVDPPFTVVESQSMQHTDRSEVGTIDTGDLILVISPENTEIVTYVEGSKTGFKQFGEYGSVIVYLRDKGNPVIHRAFIWLEYNYIDKSWSAPSLSGYSGKWTCVSDGESITDFNKLKGMLKFENIGEFGKSPYIDLDKLALVSPRSGYLTIGDNTTNPVFDQTNGVIMQSTISKEIVKSVAWVEIPMIGAMKLFINGKSNVLDAYVPNALPTVILTLITIFIVLSGIGYLYDVRLGSKICKDESVEKPIKRRK